MDDVISAVFATNNLTARDFQIKAIEALLGGKDTFVSAPTGSGKTFVYAFIPEIARKLSRPGKVIVITPLISLMVDQVRRMKNLGIAAGFLGEKQSDPNVEKGVRLGEFDLVFMSPECAVNSKWFELFSSKVYRQELCCVVIDECHCISQWYGLIF